MGKVLKLIMYKSGRGKLGVNGYSGIGGKAAGGNQPKLSVYENAILMLAILPVN